MALGGAIAQLSKPDRTDVNRIPAAAANTGHILIATTSTPAPPRHRKLPASMDRGGRSTAAVPGEHAPATRPSTRLHWTGRWRPENPLASPDPPDPFGTASELHP